MAKTVRWGVLGTGAIAYKIAEDFDLVPDAQIRAICSRSKSSAKQFAQQFNIPTTHVGLDSMLADDQIDIIYIATPHPLHHDHSLACLRRGKAVLCEKPFTVNAVQAAEIIDEAHQRKLFCMEAMWMRFSPLIQEVKTRIDQNEIGEIQFINADFGYPQHYDPKSRFFNLALGGGSLLDRGIYSISLAQYLLGNPTDISGIAHIGESGVDEQSICSLRFEQGAIAMLASTLNGLSSNETIITGNKGRLRIHEPFYRPNTISVLMAQASADTAMPGKGFTAGLKRNAAFRKWRHRLQPTLGWFKPNRKKSSFSPGHGYQYELMEATRCLQKGRTESDIMPLDDTLEVMRIMDKLRHDWGLIYPDE